MEKTIADVVAEGAIVFPIAQGKQIHSWRISPVFVVKANEKRRVIDYKPCEGVGNNQKSGEGSVNATKEWSLAPECALAGVMHGVLKRLVGLRGKFGLGARIHFQKMDAVGVDMGRVVTFGRLLANLVFIDLRLQFGRRASLVWGKVVPSAIEDSQRQMTRTCSDVNTVEAHIKT